VRVLFCVLFAAPDAAAAAAAAVADAADAAVFARARVFVYVFM
jgi:hypothetical protein